PGNYRFEARVVDSQGNVLGTVSPFPFLINPPFWLRWWAIVIMALSAAFVIYLLVKRRINVIKRKALFQQQLAELEGKALRAQMNPHFIFNSLNAIQELIVTQNIDAAYNYLSKFSKLLRLVLNNSEKSLILLSDELHMLHLYLELESLRFRNSFRYNVQVDQSVDADSLHVPPLLIQPFIENALWHGLMLKEGERSLNLLIEQQEGKLLCTVQDNGIGRTRSSEIKAHKIGASHFESKGLKLSQQRILLLSSEGRAGSVKIEDLYENGEPAGTKVFISLPLIHV
ncbi:MAG TPA: histidine kinase, partial [Flavisolibacter sp.]